MHKTYILIASTLLAAVTLYLLVCLHSTIETKTAPLTEQEVAITGVVTDVNTSEVALDGPTILTITTLEGTEHTVAVPSFGIQLCTAAERISELTQLAIGDNVTVRGTVDDAGVITPCNGPADMLTLTGTMLDTTYGYSFPYHKGPFGYITLEDNTSTHPDYVTGITLYSSHEYDVLTESTLPREAPPAMHVRIYNNPEQLTAPVWTLRNEREVNRQRMVGEETEAVVGGANATYFITDGLYTTKTYVVAHGSHIYVLMGEYLDRESTIYADFDNLVNAFSFIPTPDQVGGGAKIDPRIACESALAYMSFISGEAADAFVTECINGDHPEVIEQYLKDTGLNGAAI